jgi:cytidylate kinase
MDDIFLKYMGSRFKEKDHYLIKKKATESINHGPVITISRESGCSANIIAEMLVSSINKKYYFNSDDKWNWVNKTIIAESAKELDLPPHKIKYIFNSEKRGIIDDVISSLTSRYYKSDMKIRKTIFKLIELFATKGNIIIVGRGGVSFTNHIKKSLNIKLQAPLNWRINKISEKHEISFDDAKKYVTEIDKKRIQLINNFMGKKADNSIFDIIFNCKTMKQKEIVETIIKLAEIKKLISK